MIFPVFKLGSDSISVNNLKAIEDEVNFYIEENVENTNINFILTIQIKKLQMCLDVYYETDKKDSIFARPVRGRDRLRPFRYDQRLGLSHRNLGTLNL